MIGHVLTPRRPLRFERLDNRVYEVDGTPNDGVNIAIEIPGAAPEPHRAGHQQRLRPRERRDVSGAVGGALEGVLLGIATLAVFLERTPEHFDFGRGSCAPSSSASPTFININVPPAVRRVFA